MPHCFFSNCSNWFDRNELKIHCSKFASWNGSCFMNIQPSYDLRPKYLFIKLQRAAIDGLWGVGRFLSVLANLWNSEALREFVKSPANALAMSTKLRNLTEIRILIRLAILRTYRQYIDDFAETPKLGRACEISHDLRLLNVTHRSSVWASDGLNWVSNTKPLRQC